MKKQKKKSGSGKIFEKQVKRLLELRGWECDPNYVIGKRLGKDSDHRIDIVAGNDSSCLLISCKYQDTAGTAIDKIPYEYMCLLKEVEHRNLTGAYIVVFGKELQDQKLLSDSGLLELAAYMRVSPKVKIISFQDFQRLVITDQLAPGLPLQPTLFEGTCTTMNS